MRLTDPVADLLTRIRNAIRSRHQKVDVPASKLKLEIARILKEEGYIANFKAVEEEGHKVLRIYLKYGNNNEAAKARVMQPARARALPGRFKSAPLPLISICFVTSSSKPPCRATFCSTRSVPLRVPASSSRKMS